MSSEPLRALIVDDDPVSRKTIGFSLEQETFRCDYAGGAAEALELMAGRQFDLVVTDLCMPQQHGHSLAVEILAMPNRPLVIVHSGVDDPRMTRELINRGVDDVIYKPTNYAGFAAKAFVWALRQRRRRSMQQGECQESIVADTKGGRNRVSNTIDLFFAATSDIEALKDLSEKIRGDHSLSEAVLREANRVEFNGTDRRTTDIMMAIRQLGLRKLADVALDQLSHDCAVSES